MLATKVLHSCCGVPLRSAFTAVQLMYMDLGLSLRVKCTSSYAIASLIEHAFCCALTVCCDSVATFTKVFNGPENRRKRHALKVAEISPSIDLRIHTADQEAAQAQKVV